ncbi:uncharacterized protein DFL_008264 [Arthrobotrys flagrans]|uniref:non-specific serine/threonine protein kinase n=1 Tax=Arthrobotrys flagrans TaxID=97331 RepID=A0A436ZN80_ARTFL|nr:hypothetical protein DFL_008264 [Arthrobotrys flagrans]
MAAAGSSAPTAPAANRTTLSGTGSSATATNGCTTINTTSTSLKNTDTNANTITNASSSSSSSVTSCTSSDSSLSARKLTTTPGAAASNTASNTSVSPPLTPTSTSSPSATANITDNLEPTKNSLPPSPLPTDSHQQQSEKPPSRLLSSLSSSFLQLATLTKQSSSASASAPAASSAKKPKLSSRSDSTPTLNTSSAYTSRTNSPLASSPTCPPTGLTEPLTTATTSVSAVVVTPQKPRRTHTSSDSQANSATDLLKMAMAQNGLLRLENEDEVSGQRTPRPDFQDRRIPAILHGFQQPIAGIKDTPPATPRGTTSEGKALTSIDTKIAKKGSDSSGSATSPVTRPPRGKITVRVIAGRNLRTTPSSPNGPKDPYIVCTFESNESISKGPSKKDDVSGKPIGIPGLRGISIPMKSRTSSSTDLQTLGKEKGGFTTANWDHEAIFDVVQDHSEMVVTIYDRENQETFVGMVRIRPILKEEGTVIDEWFPLQPRSEEERSVVTGEIQLQVIYEKTAKKHFGPSDFQILRLIGRGTFGQVYQVRKKDTNRIYAMKVLSKKVIVQKKEVAHTIGERNILVRTATTDSPFIVGLKFSFQTPTDLFLVTDYMSGGELFWHLQQEGRFSEERAKFYIAELILALEHLHNHDIVYRDLKPENILLDANGHIALCDFGLSKSNLSKNETTNTFCGTTEYLAPEVLLDEQGYTKMVDFWSLGVLVFEMCCGWSPFFAEDTQQMYKNIAFGKVRFPKDALSLEGRNFVKGLLNRNPKHRLGALRDAAELKEHPFFADVDWEALKQKKSIPPFKPTLKSETDTQNFDTEFTNAPIPGSVRNDIVASTPLSPGMQNAFRGFTFVDERTLEEQFGKSVQSHHSHEDHKMDDGSDDDDDFDEGFSHRGKGGANGRLRNGDDDGMFATDNIDI